MAHNYPKLPKNDARIYALFVSQSLSLECALSSEIGSQDPCSAHHAVVAWQHFMLLCQVECSQRITHNSLVHLNDHSKILNLPEIHLTQDRPPRHLQTFQIWFHTNTLHPLLSHPSWTRPRSGINMIWIKNMKI